MREHASACRDFDESFTAFRQPLMIAAETTPLRDPGKAPLDDPSSGKNFEASL